MQPVQIEIEMIHDVICSWCPIGYSNLKAALKRLEGRVEARIGFLPYELNPEMPPEGETVEAHMKRRRQWTSDQYLHYRNDLVETARAAGLDYNVEKRTHYWNSAKAHVLLHIAARAGLQEQVNRLLIQAYFTEGVKIDDTAALVAIAGEVGLEPFALQAALSSPRVADEMQAKQERVRALAFRSIPSFVINRREILTGSNSVEFFEQYLSGLLSPAEQLGAAD